MAELVLTRHARLAVERRGIKRGELRQAVYHPDSIEPGKHWRTERRSRACEATGETVVAIVRPTRRKLLLITAFRLGGE